MSTCKINIHKLWTTTYDCMYARKRKIQMQNHTKYLVEFFLKKKRNSFLALNVVPVKLCPHCVLVQFYVLQTINILNILSTMWVSSESKIDFNRLNLSLYVWKSFQSMFVYLCTYLFLWTLVGHWTLGKFFYFAFFFFCKAKSLKNFVTFTYLCCLFVVNGFCFISLWKKSRFQMRLDH